MKKILLAGAIVAAAVTQMPSEAQAGVGENYIGPTISFGNGETTLGINSKFGVAENLSLRPFVSFPSNRTQFGTSLTYDFDLVSRTPVTPFAGAGIVFNSSSGVSDSTAFLQAGADFNVSQEFTINGSLNIPLRSGSSTFLTVGAGYRF